MPMLKGPPAASSSQSKGKARPKGGRKGRYYIYDKASHYARECPDRKDSHRDDDQNPSDGKSKE